MLRHQEDRLAHSFPGLSSLISQCVWGWVVIAVAWLRFTKNEECQPLAVVKSWCFPYSGAELKLRLRFIMLIYKSQASKCIREFTAFKNLMGIRGALFLTYFAFIPVESILVRPGYWIIFVEAVVEIRIMIRSFIGLHWRLALTWSTRRIFLEMLFFQDYLPSEGI